MRHNRAMVERQPPGRPSRGRAALAGVAAAAALVLVAIAARAGSGAPSRPPGFGTVTSAASSSATVLAIVILPIAVVVGAVGWFALQVVGRRRRDDLIAAGLYRRPSRIAQAAAVVMLVAIAYLIHRGSLHLPAVNLARITGNLGSSGHHGGGAHAPAAHHGASVSSGQWLAAGECWVLLVAGALIWWRRRPRRAAADPENPGPEAQPQTAYGTIADIRAEPDPTRAVVGAYALMERLLDIRGAGRRSAEAPIEYLGRVHRDLPAAAAPAGRLTQLFLRARFAAGGVGRPAKADAIAALEQLGEPEEHTP